MSSSSRQLHFLLLPLFALPVWAAGGTYKPWQGWFLPVCGLIWVLYFLLPESTDLLPRKKRIHSLCKDLCFWAGLAFVGFLVIQTLNSGRSLVFDPDVNQWVYSAPPFPFLPSSVNQAESLEMISWFAPTLTAFVLIRQNWTRFSLRSFLYLICLNGFLNALLAFVHVGMNWVLMYNFQRFGRDVYGSFGYPNHGALYFILLFAISLGLLLHELFTEPAEREKSCLILSAIWTPVFFVAANLSTSRAGILGSWLVLLFTLISILIISAPRLHPVQRCYVGLTAFLFAGMLFTGLTFVMKDIHVRELKNATVRLNIYNEIDGRFWQVENAWDIWKDHPLIGVGGWGYKYFAAMYLPQEEWHLIQGKKGKANVHHDFMQYLTEFGLVGMGLLTAAFVSTLWKALRGMFRPPRYEESGWATPLRIAAFAGWGILIADSMIDIPFRSPAVMMHGILLLLMILPHRDFPGIWTPVVDWKRLQPPISSAKSRIWGVQAEDISD